MKPNIAISLLVRPLAATTIISMMMLGTACKRVPTSVVPAVEAVTTSSDPSDLLKALLKEYTSRGLEWDKPIFTTEKIQVRIMAPNRALAMEFVSQAKETLGTGYEWRPLKPKMNSQGRVTCWLEGMQAASY